VTSHTGASGSKNSYVKRSQITPFPSDDGSRAAGLPERRVPSGTVALSRKLIDLFPPATCVSAARAGQGTARIGTDGISRPDANGQSSQVSET